MNNSNRNKNYRANDRLDHKKIIKSAKSKPEVALGSRVSDASVTRMAEEKTDQVVVITNNTSLHTGAEQQCQDDSNAEHDAAQHKSDIMNLSAADTERHDPVEPESTPLSDDIAGNAVLTPAKEMPDQIAVTQKDDSPDADIEAEQRRGDSKPEVALLDDIGSTSAPPMAEENLNQLAATPKDNSSDVDVNAQLQCQNESNVEADTTQHMDNSHGGEAMNLGKAEETTPQSSNFDVLNLPSDETLSLPNDKPSKLTQEIVDADLLRLETMLEMQHDSKHGIRRVLHKMLDLEAPEFLGIKPTQLLDGLTISKQAKKQGYRELRAVIIERNLDAEPGFLSDYHARLLDTIKDPAEQRRCYHVAMNLAYARGEKLS